MAIFWLYRDAFWLAVSLTAVWLAAWLWMQGILLPWRVWTRLRRGYWPHD